jgi:DNA-nicking Smr family endonuclease
MSAGAGRRGRPLTKDEHDLWKGVTRAIKPLRKSASKAVAGRAEIEAPDKPAKKTVKTKPPAPLPPPPVKPAVRPKGPPPLAPLDRRSRQKIARGATAIDARIDLHGMTQAEAHATLARFLRAAQSKGGRTVLVITGKGTFGRDGERGVLKRQVPHWLALADLRDIVLGFEDAAIGHGGEGALYVRLRKKR